MNAIESGIQRSMENILHADTDYGVRLYDLQHKYTMFLQIMGLEYLKEYPDLNIEDFVESTTPSKHFLKFSLKMKAAEFAKKNKRHNKTKAKLDDVIESIEETASPKVSLNTTRMRHHHKDNDKNIGKALGKNDRTVAMSSEESDGIIKRISKEKLKKFKTRKDSALNTQRKQSSFVQQCISKPLEANHNTVNTPIITSMSRPQNRKDQIQKRGVDPIKKLLLPNKTTPVLQIYNAMTESVLRDEPCKPTNDNPEKHSTPRSSLQANFSESIQETPRRPASNRSKVKRNLSQTKFNSVREHTEKIHSEILRLLDYKQKSKK